MGALANLKHEKFARLIFEGKPAAEAYELAGYKRHDGNASRLRNDEKVVRRIAELQERTIKRTAITIDRISDMLEEDRRRALENNQTSAAVAATMGLAKVHGLIVDKKEDVTRPTRRERLDRAAELLRRQGAGLDHLGVGSRERGNGEVKPH